MVSTESSDEENAYERILRKVQEKRNKKGNLEYLSTTLQAVARNLKRRRKWNVQRRHNPLIIIRRDLLEWLLDL